MQERGYPVPYHMNTSKIIQRILPYINSLLIIFLTTFLGSSVRTIFGPMNLDMFYLLIVVMIAIRWGRGPAIMTSIASVFMFNHFFVPPHTSVNGFDIQSASILIAFLIVGFLVSTLTSKIREQAIEASEREQQATMLYQLSKDLASSDSFKEVLEVLRVKIGEIFNCYVTVFFKENGHLELISSDPEFPLTEYELGITQWVSENGQPAGSCTNMFKESKAQYLPLKTAQGVLGVLGVFFKEDKVVCNPKENYLLNTLANQAAMAIQRTKLAEVSHQIELLRETEKLQTALLNSISHDLRTPLVSIMGVLDTLLHDSSSLDSQTREELLATAYADSDHLNRLVSNLLDMTRLEAKALKFHIEPCELRDMVGSSLQSLKDAIEKRKIIIDIPDDCPEIHMDFVLMMRVFINLVDNAIKYSRPDSTITIRAEHSDDKIRIDVKDEGIGIPKDDVVKIFDKFYRAAKPHQITGTGLGLSICKGIVELHKGEIFARNNPDLGVTMSVVLPLIRKEQESYA